MKIHFHLISISIRGCWSMVVECKNYLDIVIESNKIGNWRKIVSSKKDNNKIVSEKFIKHFLDLFRFFFKWLNTLLQNNWQTYRSIYLSITRKKWCDSLLSTLLIKFRLCVYFVLYCSICACSVFYRMCILLPTRVKCDTSLILNVRDSIVTVWVGTKIAYFLRCLRNQGIDPDLKCNWEVLPWEWQPSSWSELMFPRFSYQLWLFTKV